MVQLSYPCMTAGKIIALTIWTFVRKLMPLLLTCCLGCHSFSSKEQVSFNFMATITIHNDSGAQEKKICHCFHCFPICHDMMGTDAMILVFWMLSFKPTFSLFSFTFPRGSLVSLCFLSLEWYNLHIWGYWYFPQQSWKVHLSKYM